MAAADKEELRILLIGHTGHGKSSTGNTLLGKEVFKISGETQSCTDTCKAGETDLSDGVHLVVVDTPGLFDTHIPKASLMEQLLKIVLLTTPGFHAIVYVLRPDRFTDELQKTKRMFFEWFGKNVRDYFCIICTHASNDDDVQQYTNNPHPEFASLLQDCGGGIFPFDNKSSNSMKQQQTRRFLSHVHRIKDKNNGKPYGNLAYKIASAYVKNIDISTLSHDVLSILYDAGVNEVKGLLKSIHTVTHEKPKYKPHKEGGNLPIFEKTKEGTDVNVADIEQSETETELQDMTSWDSFSDDLRSSNTTPKDNGSHRTYIQRANRVFVKVEETDAMSSATTINPGQQFTTVTCQQKMDPILPKRTRREGRVFVHKEESGVGTTSSLTTHENKPTPVTCPVQPEKIVNTSDPYSPKTSTKSSAWNDNSLPSPSTDSDQTPLPSASCESPRPDTSDGMASFRKKVNDDDGTILHNFYMLLKRFLDKIRSFIIAK